MLNKLLSFEWGRVENIRWRSLWPGQVWIDYDKRICLAYSNKIGYYMQTGAVFRIGFVSFPPLRESETKQNILK